MGYDLPANSARIRLLLVEHQALFREALARLLAAEPDFEMAGQCGSTREALELLRLSKIDIVLLDFDVDADHGKDFIHLSREAGFQGTMLLMAAAIQPAALLDAVRLGTAGVFLKHNSSDTLARAIRLVAGGEMWLDRKTIEIMAGQMQQLATQASTQSLTAREQEVLQGVVEGLTNRKIASAIGVSEGTVKATLQQLFQKTQVRKRSQLVRAAMEQSLVPVTRRSSTV